MIATSFAAPTQTATEDHASARERMATATTITATDAKSIITLTLIIAETATLTAASTLIAPLESVSVILDTRIATVRSADAKFTPKKMTTTAVIVDTNVELKQTALQEAVSATTDSETATETST